MKFSAETIGQIYASGRNYLNLFLGMLCGIGLMSAAQEKGLLDAVGEMYNGIVQIVHGATSAWSIIAIVAAPIIGPLLARMASNSAKISNQAVAVQAATADPKAQISVETKAAILDAAANSAPLAAPIKVTDAALANLVPSPKVIS